MRREKVICWIDDSPKSMSNIVSSVFKKLWTQSIHSDVIFFGDSYKSEEQELDLSNEFYESYKDKVFSISSAFQRQQATTDIEKTQILIPKIESVKCILSDKFKDITNEWKKIEKNDDVKQDKFNIKPLAELIISEFENVSCYGLDLSLLFMDRERIVLKDLPVISMAIYNYLKIKKIPCFIYSTANYDMTCINKWAEIYKKIYSSDSLHKNDMLSRQMLLSTDNDFAVKHIVSKTELASEGE